MRTEKIILFTSFVSSLALMGIGLPLVLVTDKLGLIICAVSLIIAAETFLYIVVRALLDDFKKEFVCKNCGNKSQKWLGKCPICGHWNTYEEKQCTV